MDIFNDRSRYWEKSRRVREAFYRQTLADLLHLAFDPQTLKVPDPHFLENLLRELVRMVEPSWVIDEVDRHLVRAEMTQALETLQSYAHAIAENRITLTH